MTSLSRMVSGAVGLVTLPGIYLRLTEVATDVLKMFDPMVVEAVDIQMAPRARSAASSVVE